MKSAPTIGDILRYLYGSRSAILAIGSSRWSLLIGAMLVFSGSLARNYDGAYLVAEWHVFLHGIVVSTLNAFVLYALVFVAATAHKAESGAPFWSGCLSFLGLFWMTAPMAWVYGIPYERFMTPVDALHANMISLGCVSIWRVLLISRALAVIFGDRTRRVVWITLAFADGVLLAALWVAPLPVIDFMGGMQQSPEERELASAAFLAGFWGVVTAPVWLIGALIAAARMKGRWSLPARTPQPMPRISIAVASVAILAWIAAALAVQPEQRRRFETERLLRAGRIEEALAAMSAYPRSAFPPVWDPPPRPTWHILEPPIEKVRAALADIRHARWVDDLFWEKCWRDLLRTSDVPWQGVREWSEYAPYSSPSDSWLAAAQMHADHDPRLTDNDRNSLVSAIQTWKAKQKKKD